MKKRVLLYGSIILFVVCLMFTIHAVSRLDEVNGKPYDIIVYGGGPQAVASAIKASETTNDEKKILMIVPENQLGSIFTAGGQNLFDLREYKSTNLPDGLPAKYQWAQGGTMYDLYKETSIVFSVDKMRERLNELVKEHENITVLYEHDIEKVYTHKNSIEKVRVYPIVKNKQGRYVYDKKNQMLFKSRIFIDASETGKLTYTSGLFKGAVGREDIGVDNKQMVSTLMFKLKGMDMDNVQKHEKEGAPFIFYFSEKGSLGGLGGYEINDVSLNEKFVSYSQENELFRLKPYNAGEDSYSGKNQQTSETEMWMNMLLVYDVDGRKMWRDKVAENGNYPIDGGLDPEIAREKAMEELKKPEFIKLVRELPGLDKAEFVLNDDEEPVAGDIMYLRETIHSSNKDGSFALTEEDTYGLKDEKYYDRRIGLGFYNFDSNTYDKGEALSEPRTVNPWYVPYEVLTSTPDNLLIPGYATNMDSYTWRAMRVYPNLLVLGDAAGVAAGLSSEGKFSIQKPNKKELKLLQTELEKQNAVLEK